MNYTDNINFKGKFKKYDPNGNLMKYSIGDTVEFNGNLYTATKPIIALPPTTVNAGWELLSSTSSFSISDDPPTNSTSEGDRWYNSSTGILYTRIRDDSGYYWIQL